LLGAAAPLRAEGVSTVLDFSARLAPSGRYGAGATVDGLWGQGRVRGGLSLGIDAISAGDTGTSAVVSPLGIAAQLRRAADTSSPYLGVRAGAAPGALQGQFFCAAFGAFGAGYAWRLGEGAFLRAGLEAWGAWSEPRKEFWVSPSIGLGL
jgi:hypothetical protein